MKSFLLLLVALMTSAAFAVGGSSLPTAPTFNAPLEWSIEIPAASFAADTLAGEDSATLISLYPFRGDKGGKFIMEAKSMAGTGSDSVSQRIRVDLYNESKAFVRSISLDSIVLGTVGSAYTLPIGLTAFASYVTVKLIPYGSSLNGGSVILPAGYITVWKVQPYTRSKLWQ